MCRGSSGQDLEGGLRNPRGHMSMGTSLRSGAALQEALDLSPEASWDLALTLGFGAFWES